MRSLLVILMDKNLQLMNRQQDQIEIMGLLLDLWLSTSELRFGQLLENIFGCTNKVGSCIFGTSDESLLDRIEVFKELCKPTESP